MKPNEVREKSVDELTKMRGEMEEEIFRLRFRKNSGQLKQTANIKKVRRDLARVNTILNQKMAAGKETR
ncbi:MAG TPA: 50S ribosomal protein L29 [bacterium]|nr:50S ribosomal protein L29 [Myxococcales bacterium]OQA58626.1 MAG: 50S ribosomal protein L29 [bacterium ADurb.Bin270]HPW45372.1 50S ribosomal protein L29 [bacterium]HQG14136.1 50S ribosomal protein L29 [bacterium]HQH80206.1 50S ribosomal protein L29 [bacterium]